jgi:hypothetical protein
MGDSAVSTQLRIAVFESPQALRVDDALRHAPSVKYRRTVHHDHNIWREVQFNEANCIFVDPIAIGIERAADFIFRTRTEHPEVVFVLYFSSKAARDEPRFYDGERARFRHYYTIDTDLDDLAFNKEMSKVIARCENAVRPRYEYEVALSFAGEQRELAKALHDFLKKQNITCFFDEEEQATLWGKDLFDHLSEIYSKRARYCVIFVSGAYADKVWTTHERRAAQERALRQKSDEYILPIRCDGTKVPGLNENVAYVSAELGMEKIAQLLAKKLCHE